MSAPSSLSTDPLRVLTVLAATQQPETRLEAERELEEYARTLPSYGRLLASLLAAASAAEGAAPPNAAQITPIPIPPPITTLIAIVLKRYVQHHWSESSEVFEAPVVSDEEKSILRPMLLPLLHTPHAAVRKQVAATVALVAEVDCPDRWPQLIHDITQILAQAKTAPNSPPALNVLLGSLEVLVSFCEELTEEQLCATVPALFPALLDICQSRVAMLQHAHALNEQAIANMGEAQIQAIKDAIALCRCALQVYERCCEALFNMNDVVNESGGKGKKQPKDAVLMQYLQPTLPQWLSLFNSLLCLPTPASVSYAFLTAVPAMWSVRVECVRALLCVGEHFAERVILGAGVEGARAIEAGANTLLDTMEGLWPLYEQKVLNAKTSGDGEGAEEDDEEEEEDVDDEGNIISMSAYLYEAFMYIKHVVSMQQPLVKKAAKKGKGKGATASQPDPTQAAWQHLQSLFAPPSSPMLSRILGASVRYLQLSAKEVSASLGHVDEYLSYQSSGGEDSLGVGLLAAQTVNVRTAVKELMLECMLANDDDEEDEEEEEARSLALMGFSGQARASLNNPNYPLLDRAHVLHLLCPMLTAMLQQSAAARARQPRPDPNWWKAREAATMLLAHCVHDITHINQEAAKAAANPKQAKGKKAATPLQPIPFDLQSFIRDILLPDLSTSPPPSSLPPPHPLLRAQALNATALFAPVFERAQESNLVLMALESLVGNMAPSASTGSGGLIVRISAVHAFGALCGILNNKSLLTHNNILVQALSNICQLVHTAATVQKDEGVEESALLEVLSTLMMAMEVDEQITASAEPSLTPLLLGAWSANAHKPSISDAIVDLFSQLLKLTPSVCTSVQTRLLPAIEHILKQNTENVAITGTVSAALDLLFNVLRSVERHTRQIHSVSDAQQGNNNPSASPSSPASVALPELLHPLLFSSLLPLTLDLLLHTDDHSLVEVGMHIIATFLRIHAPSVANLSMNVRPPSSPPGSPTIQASGLQVVCMVAQRFLDPKLDDKLAHNVGNLVVQMVFTLGNVLGEQNVKEIVKAVVSRLYSSAYPPLTQSLLLVFARLIHSSGSASILGFLSSLGRIPVLEKKLVPVRRKPTDRYTSELRTEMTPAEVDALTYTLTRWMQAQTDIHARYPTKVMLLALANLLTFLLSNENGAAQLRTLECRGYPLPTASSSSKRVTRSQARHDDHEPRYSSMPLPAKILAILMTEYRELQEKEEMKRRREEKRKKKQNQGDGEEDEGEEEEDEEYDDEDDDEEFDDDDDDDEFIAGMMSRHRGSGPSSSPFAPASAFPERADGGRGGSALISLSDLLDEHEADELDEELEDEVYPEAATDPLTQLELDAAIQACATQAAAASQDRQMWSQIASCLNQDDQKMLQLAIEKHNQQAQQQPRS